MDRTRIPERDWKLLSQLTARLHALGLLTEDERGAFTEETHETVAFLLSAER